MLKQSYQILDSLRLPHGLYLASPSTDYSYVWLRDSFYEVMPYLDKPCDTYEKTYHRMLDMFKEYEWKLDVHTKQKPREQWEYIHARYDAQTVTEIDTPWGHAQHDAVGAVLFGIGQGIKAGKKILRDEKDREVIQKVVWYLNCCKYWEDKDNGIWEENREVRSSSIGACVAGLKNVADLVYVPAEMIAKGYEALYKLFPKETKTRNTDLALLTLIYPYNLLPKPLTQLIINNVEKELLRKRGVIRYKYDSYYSTLEKEFGRHQSLEFYDGSEAEWTFGLPWLALCHMELGNYSKAKYYIDRTEGVMLENGSLPELYFADSDRFNVNQPLGWSNAMYILAKEKLSN